MALRTTHMPGLQFPPALWPAVADAGGTGWPPATDDQADAFIRQSANEGLLPIVFDQPPDPLIGNRLRAWRAMDAANRHRAVSIASAIPTLPAVLGTRDMILLKGSDWGPRLYGSLHLRPMSDIDVLVPLSLMRPMDRRMAAAGHRRIYGKFAKYAASYPDAAYDLGVVTLEVHHSFFQRARARVDYDGVWSRKVPVTINGLETFRLDDVDSLLMMIINIAKSDLATPLLRYLDVWMLATHDISLLSRAEPRAREWKISNAFHSVMIATQTIFPDLPSVDAPRKAMAIDHFVRPQDVRSMRDVTRLSLLRRAARKFWLIDDMPLRVHFMLSHFLATIAGAALRAKMPRVQP